MAIAGRVAIVPKGDWSAEATYKRLDAVTYNNTLYFAKKDVPAGTETSNTEYWSKSIVGGVCAIAKPEEAGIVKPDGKSMSVDESGTLSINLDGTTITLDEAKNVIKLADTLKEKINGAFPAANLINNLTTTEAGFGLDARQGKALDDKITEINGSLNTNMLNISYIPKTFKLFNDVPLTTGIHVYCVTGYGDPVADSPYPNLDGWWNIIQFGVDGNGSLFRLTQIASQVFQAEFGFKGKDELWIRSRHDAVWSNWVKL